MARLAFSCTLDAKRSVPKKCLEVGIRIGRVSERAPTNSRRRRSGSQNDLAAFAETDAESAYEEERCDRRRLGNFLRGFHGSFLLKKIEANPLPGLQCQRNWISRTIKHLPRIDAPWYLGELSAELPIIVKGAKYEAIRCGWTPSVFRPKCCSTNIREIVTRIAGP